MSGPMQVSLISARDNNEEVHGQVGGGKENLDGLVAHTMFTFQIVPHDYYTTCFYCELHPDTPILGKATIRTS